VDIHGAKLALAKEALTGTDGVLRQVRVGQFTESVVRVVLDLNNVSDHRAFVLADPFRVIVDVQGQKPAGAAAAFGKKPIPGVATDRKPTTAQPIGLRKIVLDPGHGGKDPGAIGAGGIAEKDLVLMIAKKLAVKLKREMGVEVILTRSDDTFIPLEGRTAIANAEQADLFVSLHMNASPNADAKGLETYYLDKTNDEASIRLAARENSTSRKNVSDLQFILSDMMQSMKLEDSISLAHRLQTALVSGMSRKIDDVKDLGVKKALFYVLVGARMPSVLVEMLFITNKSEGQAMTQETYQDAMADALFEGIAKYNESSMAMKTL
jgi:N-acetylmuramoyl-L-alanine amidase